MTGMPLYERMPPHDIDIEEAVLAALMVDAPDMAEVVATLKSADFFRQQHAWVFDAVSALWARGMTVNQLTVARELAQRNLLEDVGGQAWLSDIVRNGAVLGAVLARGYASTVQHLAQKRALIHAGSVIQQLAFDSPETDFSKLRDEAVSLLMAAGGEDVGDGDIQSAAELLDDGLDEQIERDIMEPGRMLGLSCGIQAIDRLTRGFRSEFTYYIAAETSIGKSLLVQDIAIRVASGDMGVLMFTTEMGKLEVGDRMIYMLAGLDPIKPSMSDLGWTTGEISQIRAAKGDFRRLPIRFCDRGDVTYAYLKSAVIRQRAKAPVDLIVVDHIQAMEAGGKKALIAQDLEMTARGLKWLAKEFEVPVIVVSQLSRETDHNRHDQLGRMRNSGGIPQYANFVAFMEPFTEVDGARVPLSPDDARARAIDPGWTPVHLNVMKHRGGPTGTVALVNDWRAGGRYYDYARGYQ